VDVPKELSQIDDDTAAAIKKVEFTGKHRSFDFADKQAALNTLAKIQGLIVERKQVEVQIVPIEGSDDPDLFLDEPEIVDAIGAYSDDDDS
jgi:hypothetical protein